MDLKAVAINDRLQTYVNEGAEPSLAVQLLLIESVRDVTAAIESVRGLLTEAGALLDPLEIVKFARKVEHIGKKLDEADAERARAEAQGDFEKTLSGGAL